MIGRQLGACVWPGSSLWPRVQLRTPANVTVTGNMTVNSQTAKTVFEPGLKLNKRRANKAKAKSMLKLKRLESFWPAKTHLIAGQVARGRLIETPPVRVFYQILIFSRFTLGNFSVCVAVLLDCKTFFISFAAQNNFNFIYLSWERPWPDTFCFWAQTEHRDMAETEIEKMHLLSMQTANRADNKYGRPPIFMAIKCVV